MTKLLMMAEQSGIELLEDSRMGRLKGLYVDGFIVLNPNIGTEVEKRCILGEELGHHFTSYGNILDQSRLENRKQERRARAWAYEKLIRPKMLVEAFRHGVQNNFELAEFLNVTEAFLRDALLYFNVRYWPCCKAGDYYITFDPLNVKKRREDN